MPQKVSLCRMWGDLSRLVVSPSPEPGSFVCVWHYMELRFFLDLSQYKKRREQRAFSCDYIDRL